LSMSQETTLPLVKKIAQGFINSVLNKDTDRAAVIGFTGEVTSYQSLTNDFAAAGQKIEMLEIKVPEEFKNIPRIPRTAIIVPSGRLPNSPKSARQTATSLWDSVREVSEKGFANERSNAGKAILLMTDGIDNYSEGKRKEAIATAIKNNVAVYAIGIGDPAYENVDKNSLKEIAGSSGGLAFFPENTDDLQKIFTMIARTLRSHYSAAFDTTAAAIKNNSVNEIKIEIINPDLRKRKLQIAQPKGFFVSQ
jgi:VWFA-related protein